MNGYIKLHRQILDWEWYDDANTLRLFIHCLIEANHKDKEWRGITINRGQFHTSIGILAAKLKLSDKAIRIALDKLIRTNEMAIKGANNGTMITICNYDTYQGIESTEGQTEGQAKGQTKGKPKGKPRATTKNDKNDLRMKENKEDIPTFEIFLSYALLNEPLVCEKSLKLKYEAWKVNGWKTGKNNEIINWKSTLLNTLKYIDKTISSNPQFPQFPQFPKFPQSPQKQILQGQNAQKLRSINELYKSV